MNEHYLNEVNLNDVTVATSGSGVNTNKYQYKTVFVNVSLNTGAVTVNIEASPDGSTWYNLDSKTYTATTGTDVFEYESNYPMLRTTTTSQGNATVKTTITGSN